MAHSYYCVMATCLYAYLLSISIVYVSMSSRTTPTSRNSDKFVLRMPDGMRDTIAELAKQSGRSMNAEIVYRLQKSIDEEQVEMIHQIGFAQVENYRFGPPPIKLAEPLEELEQILAKAKKIVDEVMKERAETDDENDD